MFWIPPRSIYYFSIQDSGEYGRDVIFSCTEGFGRTYFFNDIMHRRKDNVERIQTEDSELRHSANGPQGRFQWSYFVSTLSRLIFPLKRGEVLSILYISGFSFQILFQEVTLPHFGTCSFYWEITANKQIDLKGTLNKAGNERTVT
jgi:hypothetical protein